jgi:hypothetical protein
MRKAFCAISCLLALFCAASLGRADSTWELSVQVSATVQSSPARITLTWPQDTTTTPSSYVVYRKAVAATSWGNPVSLPGSATSYTDSSVSSGVAYEYQVVKNTSVHTGYGYIVSGINLPMTDYRGKVLLVVENTHATALASELARLQQDLVGDGWSVVRIDVNRNDSVASVKSQIRNQYNADPANVKSVFLFGRVPVPYSGNTVPDGHTPEHQGAWPADAYYGDMDGTWTDSSVNISSAESARTRNVPGDGKFDQTILPAPLKLAVGRVDLSNMPGRLYWGGPATFPSELELLRNYLNKDHKFRQKLVDLPRRGIVGDYFGWRDGEAFAASGWRTFAPFFGANNITTLPNKGTWIPTLKNNAYLWAYGCGAGSYTSIGGLGNTGQYQDGITTEMYQNDVKAAFTMLFGSWLGDWDAEDNIQRSILALPSYGLTCAWSGRPHWFFHHMALGETIGFSTRLTQNNGSSGLYRNQINSVAGQIHVALMGDPTLRMHAVAPVSNVRLSGNTVSWNASTDSSIVGYHIYKAPAVSGPFTRLTSAPVNATSYTDSTGAGANYMVRAVKLESSASGTYYNPAQGAFLAPFGASSGSYNPTNGSSGDSGGSDPSTPPVVSDPNPTTPPTTTPTTPTGTVVYFDDVLPAAASAGATANDSWNWVNSNPTPYSGAVAHRSNLSAGLHEHYFSWATGTMSVSAGDVLFTYIYLDPANPPSEIMLQWFDGSWDHRAYWGANQITHGTDGTAGRRYMGPLPIAGQWVLLEVPASAVGLEGKTVNGMGFTLFGGTATWDYSGKAAASLITTTPTVQTNSPQGGYTSSSNSSGSLNITNNVAWVDDSLPSGAQAAAEGGDTWFWTSSNPAPISGGKAHQSAAVSGLHQHFFTGATSKLTINAGEKLFAYIYLDPVNPPSEIMLQWHDGSWEHRAYWGADQINYGTPGTTGRRYMGSLPASGQWVRLEVPASQVGLEGSTLTGMAFSLYGGRATWDMAGKCFTTVSGGSGSNPSTNTTPVVPPSTPAPIVTNGMVWVDEGLPTGAVPGADGGDAWSWTASPTPFSGRLAHQSTVRAGSHQHFFTSATKTMPVSAEDTLFAYVYLDPANPPSQVMLQWCDGSWEHRAYWGANRIQYGMDGTPGRRYMGPLPAVGKWVRLEVPAAQVALGGSTVSGMAFSLFDGRATWDFAGKGHVTIPSNPGSGGTTNSGSVAITPWVEDALPAGAIPVGDGGDSWAWTSSNPAPTSGASAHPSANLAGFHQHYFHSATAKLSVGANDVLFAWVYLDPVNTPSQLMLQWNNGSWEHRAYWGANRIGFGTDGTAGRRYMGALPAAGKWSLLQVPASQVGLGGSTLNGMAFTVFDGKATWDLAGKSSALQTNTSGSNTNTVPGGGGTNTNTVPPPTNALPTVSTVDYLTLAAPAIGDYAVRALTPTLLELKLINTKLASSSMVNEWNFVDANFQFNGPTPGAFAVTVNNAAVPVTAVGFKRRPLYAPSSLYDLRIENSLYLQLGSPVSDNAVVEVKNPDGTLWNSSRQFKSTVDPLRYNPALHVNQEGYMPAYVKKARVGYYTGSMGELNVPTTGGFKIVDSETGAQVFQGTLTLRKDVGYTYVPTPYQKVYEADFTAFTTPGEYRLVVPGMGGSLPFMIHEGIAMSFARTYALGLYHQRCGTAVGMPHTRFTHDVCHNAACAVPTDASNYKFTWDTIAGYANSINGNNPPQIAPALTSPSAQLFPFARTTPVDAAGGHHDAGDYSKYTINSASLVHTLMFTADSLAGVSALDNLGLPESGDGISDVMQEAKWEADYLAKLQDTDGGFYFIVYPRQREYENNVAPDKGDAQVVWPKTTTSTAAAVAALAQCGSSPLFKQAYPAAAASYLQKAQLGWQFLLNAINQHGKNGAYQKITHYGDDFADNDELAWAACEIFLATGDATAHSLLKQWFDPSDPATWRWGWWRMSQCWGNAIRSYAFAPRTGRRPANQLDANYLAKCQAQVIAAGDDAVTWSQQNAYGSSFPADTKRVKAAGWYFSADQAFDIAVAQQLSPKTSYVNALIANLDFEGGCNPVNVTYITGLGWKRQRDVVNQWAVNDRQALPPSGEPVGNITANINYSWFYGSTLTSLCFPSDNAGTAPYPFYDRWTDTWNVNAEFVVLNSARGLGTVAYLAAQTALKTQAWKAPAGATITVPSGTVPVGQPVTVSMKAPAGVDLSQARITWEARDQEPAFGPTFTFSPKNNGTQWVEAEAQLPDGRRVFATASLNANSPNIVWVDDALPAGAVPGTEGGDSWDWITSSPAPKSGLKAHQSAAAPGMHQHFFDHATATLQVGAGDVLYAWVYLDPANMPSTVMLHWNDGSWEHRAYWGANNLNYGTNGTASRRYMGALPAAGQWVRLEVPASQVGLEGKTLKGMSFSLFGGRAIWDAAGRLSP